MRIKGSVVDAPLLVFFTNNRELAERLVNKLYQGEWALGTSIFPRSCPEGILALHYKDSLRE